jgi:hypothetical protein
MLTAGDNDGIPAAAMTFSVDDATPATFCDCNDMTYSSCRKARMPKDYVEGKKMDAERWLPMRDRSYYRPKGRKGKKRMEGLTQGGVVAEEKGTPAPQEKKAGADKGKNKKKGKGGKW